MCRLTAGRAARRSMTKWYEAREIEVIKTGGGRVRAVTLRVDGDRGPWVPPDPYVRLIIEGAAEANLPEDYRARLGAIVSAAQSGPSLSDT